MENDANCPLCSLSHSVNPARISILNKKHNTATQPVVPEPTCVIQTHSCLSLWWDRQRKKKQREWEPTSGARWCRLIAGFVLAHWLRSGQRRTEILLLPLLFSHLPPNLLFTLGYERLGALRCDPDWTKVSGVLWSRRLQMLGGRRSTWWPLWRPEWRDEKGKISRYVALPTKVRRLPCMHSYYLPVEGVVGLLFFLLGEDECFDRGRVRSGVSGSDRLLHDFLTPSRSLTC